MTVKGNMFVYPVIRQMAIHTAFANDSCHKNGSADYRTFEIACIENRNV